MQETESGEGIRKKMTTDELTKSAKSIAAAAAVTLISTIVHVTAGESAIGRVHTYLYGYLPTYPERMYIYAYILYSDRLVTCSQT